MSDLVGRLRNQPDQPPRFYYGHEEAKATYQGAYNAIKLALAKFASGSAEHDELNAALACLRPATYLGWDGHGASDA